MTTPQNPQPGPARETFHQEFFRRAKQFAQDVMTLIPELEAIAITPSWEVRQDRLPYGIVTGRHGALQGPQEIMHMAEQLHGTLESVMQFSRASLRLIDERMAEMAEEIHVRERQLNELKSQLRLATETQRAASGTPENPPGPG